MFTVHCSISKNNVLCSMFYVQCFLFNVQSSMFNVKCLMFNVQCLKFNFQCSLFNKDHPENNGRSDVYDLFEFNIVLTAVIWTAVVNSWIKIFNRPGIAEDVLHPQIYKIIS